MHPLVALPALASYITKNGENGSPTPLPKYVELGLFIGIPLFFIVVIGGLVFLSSSRSGAAASYRPGRAWKHPRRWFGVQPPESTATPRVSVPDLGGSRARW